MSEISNLYSSKDTIYQKKTGEKSDKSKNGNVKHIVFEEGAPVYTEIIKVSRDAEVDLTSKSDTEPTPSRIRASRSANAPKRSSDEVLKGKKAKLSMRLKKAVRESQTIWSEKNGIWISYQGRSGFLVKQFTPENRLLNSEMMSQTEILECSIPGILETSWKTL